MANSNILTPHKINRRDKFDWNIARLGSLDNSSDPSSLEPHQTPNTLNTNYDLSGAVESRKGYIKLLTTSVPGCTGIVGMHPFYSNDGVTKQIIFAAQLASNTYLYKYDNAGSSVQIGGPYATGTVWDFTTFQNKVFAVNSVDGILQYTGSGSFTVTTTAVTPQYIETRKNRLFGAAKNSSVVAFSDAGNPASWPVVNIQNINTDDGQQITGLKSYLDSIVVFKERSVWYILGEPLGAGTNTTVGNLQLKQADCEVGCSSFRTIKKIRRGILMWACESGIVIMQNYHGEIISEKLEKTFLYDMNPSYLGTMWAIYSPPEKKYILGYPSATSQTADKAILVDLGSPKEMKLSIWDHYPGSCAILYRFTGRDTVLIGHPSKGFIVQAFQGYADIAGDNGQASSATSTTLADTTKAWTTSQFVDADVTIISGTGQGQIRGITANTATGLTVSPAWATTPDSTSIYSIGAYASYRDSPIEAMGKDGIDKKFKYMNVFADSQSNYPLLFGYALDFQPLSFNGSSLSLSGGSLIWTGAGGANKWGQAGAKWGKKKDLFLRFDIGDTGKHLQTRVGELKALQPWRMSNYSITLKFKKLRPDSV